MPDILLEPIILFSILFWWARCGLMYWHHHQRQHCQYPHRVQKVKAKRRLKLPGLIKKPHCESCAQESMLPSSPLPDPPPLIVYHRGRRRSIDTTLQYCPHQGCRYYGWLGRSNIRANGHPNGRDWRQLYCASCERYFLETHGTLFYRKSRSAYSGTTPNINRQISAIRLYKPKR